MARAGYPAWDEDEAFFDERPARPARKRRFSWIRVTVMSSLIVAGLAHLAERKGGERPAVAPAEGVPASVLIAPAPVWIPVAPAPALYAVENAAGTPAVEARRHTGGAREDTLTFGRFGDARHMRITLVQGSAEPARSFFVDIVRRAAEAGLAVSRKAQGRMVETKFGPVEAAAMTLAGRSEQDCQAFRFSDRDSGFALQGWICGGEAAVMEDAQLACLIDGITLAGAGSPSLKALFARADKNRTGACSLASRTAAAGVRPPPRP